MIEYDIQQRRHEAMEAAMSDVLDAAKPPVARFRLMSMGLSPALRTHSFQEVVGDKGCLACGNCADACPVMRWRFGTVLVPNMRTSMALEHLVADSCRRCYACIRSCPQTDRGLKEFALTYRRGEKVTHAILAAAFLTLFMSGVLLFHYREVWSEGLIAILGLIHRAAVPALIITPFIYFWLDRRHLIRRLRQITTWGAPDIQWLRDWWRAMRGQSPFPTFGENHPGRKAWQLYLCLSLWGLSITGAGLWIGEGLLGRDAVETLRWTHAQIAIGVDILVAVHIIRVLLRPVWQRLRRMLQVFGREKELLFERTRFLA